MEKGYDYVTACSSQKGKNSNMEVIEDFESRSHKAVTCVVERRKEKHEWNEQKLPQGRYSGGRRPGRNTEEKGREEAECEGSEQRQKKNEIIEEVIRSSQRMAWEGQNPTQ